MDNATLFYKVGYLEAKVDMLEKMISALCKEDAQKQEYDKEIMRRYKGIGVVTLEAVKEQMAKYEDGFTRWVNIHKSGDEQSMEGNNSQPSSTTPL